MTSSERPNRPAAAGVFVVRDPEVCAALETMLAPHRTDRAQSPAEDGSAAVDGLMAAAAIHAAGLAGTDPTGFSPETTVEGLLTHVHVHAFAAGKASGRTEASTAGCERAEEIQDRARRAEAAVAHAERDVENTREDLKKELAKIAELEARPSGRRPTVSAQRQKDQAAFADLAARMDREALSQTKTPAAVLRTAAQGVRDEIAIVYGNAERKAS